jgi:lysophospholipase L1-like esterase
MKINNLLLIIYVLIIIMLTAYFSLSIIDDKGIISGKYILPFEENTQFTINDKNQSLVIDYEEIINELSNSMTLENSQSAGNVSLLMNIEGFRDYNYSIGKSNNTFRIIALGDSFTEDPWVTVNDSWPKKLERKLNQLKISTKFEVLNFGMNGANTLDELKIFEENALKYNPDMVILLFYQNDFEDKIQIKKRANELWQMYLNGSFKFPISLEGKIKELNVSEEVVYWLIERISTQQFYDDINQKGFDNAWKGNVEMPLIKLIDICKKQKIELIIIGLDLNPNEPKLLNNFLTKYGINFLDFTPYFPFEKKELRLLDMHLNEKGYDLLSTKLLEFLLQSNKIKTGR